MNIIFDYDGTLHETIHIYKPAFLAAYDYLVKNGYAQPREFTDDEIKQWVGYNSREMWLKFMPELPEEVREECSKIVGRVMIEQIEAGNACLYNRALYVLEWLREQDHTLIFLSNCKESYMNAHIKAFNLDKYFDAMYCAEHFDFKPKHEIFPEILKKHPGNYIVVGDRFKDIEMASKNGLYSIGCAYGYGSKDELKAADAIVTFPLDIISYIPAVGL